jgi:hypothetical protein
MINISSELLERKKLVNHFYSLMCKYKQTRDQAVAILFTLHTKVVPVIRIFKCVNLL